MGEDEEIRKAGCDDFLPKPISIVTFLETIRRHLPIPH